MKILPAINNNIHKAKDSSLRTLRTVGLGALFMLAPLYSSNLIPKDTFQHSAIVQPIEAKPLEINKSDLSGLNVIEETNFRGGLTKKYDAASVELLKQRIKRTDVEYCLPIEKTKDLYLHSFGMFNAPRPQGRKHLGLDIFVAKYGRKPKKAVKVLAPIDGVVIARKKANEKDNVVANSVTILGVDGRTYAFDHLARATDFDKDEAVALPEVGQIIKAKDELGNVGATGETDLWHLHLVVMTDEALVAQLSDPKFIEASKKSQYSAIKGQVDPLDETAAGEIANVLKEIPIK